jgi:hypothetical protein
MVYLCDWILPWPTTSSLNTVRRFRCRQPLEAASIVEDADLPTDYSPLVVETIHKLCDSLLKSNNNVRFNWAARKHFHFLVTSGLSHYLQIHQLARDKATRALQDKAQRPDLCRGAP